MNPLCGTDWGRLLASEFEQPYWAELRGKWAQERARDVDVTIKDAKVVRCHTRSNPNFLGSQPFSEVNRRLRGLGRDEMDWGLEP